MICARCKSLAKSYKTCTTCNSNYHPSCLKEVLKNKPPTFCCVKSTTLIKSPSDSHSSIIRPASLALSTSSRNRSALSSAISIGSSRTSSRHHSTLSSFKSANSSPRTLPVSIMGDNDVFTSPAPTGSQVETVNQNSAPPVITSQESTDNLVSKPDWTLYSMDQKMNLLLEMSFNNNVEIRNVTQVLSKHGEDIKRLNDSLYNNTADILKLSDDVKSVNDTLVRINDTQQSSAVNLQKVADKCNENSTAITLLQSALVTVAKDSDSRPLAIADCSSKLLISGLPDSIATKLKPEEITHQLFSKLKIPQLENDVLSVRELKVRRPTNDPRSKPTTCSFILSMKSPQVCDHILDVKRRMKSLLLEDIFPTMGVTSGRIYLNDFLDSNTYKLLMRAKAKAKNLNYKYAWAQKGVIYLKKDDRSEKIVVKSSDDLNNLA